MKNGSSLRARLSSAIRAIRAGIRAGAPEWVADNYYLIDRQYNAARKNEGLRKAPEMEEVAAAYLASVGWKLTEESLLDFFREQSQRSPLEYAALSAVPAMLAANAILRIGGICEGKKNASLLPEAVGVLRTLSDLSAVETASALFEAAWKPEAILSASETDYTLFSPETKASYRQALSRSARAHRTGESEEALRLAADAKEKGVPIGELLFPRKAAVGAILVWWSSFLLLLAAGVFLCAAAFGWLTLLLLLPLAEGISPVSDRLSALFRREHAALRLALPSIPDRARTVVAVTSLLQRESDAAERLERFYYLNREENLSFCLLADFPEAKTPHTEEDEELLAQAKATVDRLNAAHGERFFLLYREREELESGRFGGKERKRGAVGALIRRLSGEEAGLLHGTCPSGVRYLLTLDADTELSPGVVRELLGVALHPVNRSFGVFQPAIQTELLSSYRTHFTRLISGSAGISFYERAAFDRNMSLYGEGIFCGKGLLDVERFRQCALDLPEGKILSHDLPEGGLLRTLLVSDLPLMDSVPNNPASWYRRAHRWIRGDVQNLPLLFQRRYPLSFVSRRQILCNLLRHLTPISALLAVAVGAFLARGELQALYVFFAAYSYLLLPFLVGCVSDLLSGGPFLLRHAFTAGLSAFAEAVLRLGNDVCSACRSAFLSLDAVARSLWRMTVSHRRLLQWTTAAAGESGSGRISVYLRQGLPGALTGCLLFLFGGASVYRLLGILFFLDPMLSYLLSLPLARGGNTQNGEVSVTLTEKDASFLRKHASDQWNFFADTVTRDSHFLPPDNLQLSPSEEKAMRTSPTNIGLFLLSVLAALDLGLVDAKEAADRLERTLATVEGLPKFHGNLYNWYDLKTLAVLGEAFVSFVDSGNFVTCLLTLEKGLTEYGDAEERFSALAKQSRRLADETDLSVFYDERKALFSLGWDSLHDRREPGCYDMLMSEARTASYYAVAAGIVPKKHWYTLCRTVAAEKGYIGMVSWSGTMFEYFMPQLFLPIYRNSFLQETLLFSVWAQRRAARGKPWGVSESAYYAFDGELHYRYHAHGIPTLALRRDVTGETVISPYSTYLALAICPTAAVRNLRALEECGMYGKYGLYEAFDRTPGRSRDGVAVRSYMAHHMGMSLLAIANAVEDRVFVRRFMADPRMKAAAGLLQEKLPPNPALLTEGLRVPTKTRRLLRTDRPTESSETDFCAPKAALLCKDGFSACITSLGHVRLRKGPLLVNDCRTERFSCAHTLLVSFPEEHRTEGCTPFFGEGAYSFETNADSASLIAGSKRFSGRVQFSFSRRADCFCAETRSENRRSRPVLFAFEPVLAEEASYDAHQAFSKLFIESSYEPETRILYFARRDRETGRPICWLAAALKDRETAFTFCTSKDGFPAESLNTPADFNRPLDGKTGACIDPLCVIRTAPCQGGRATLLLSVSGSRAEARKAILAARHEKEKCVSGARPETCSLLASLLFPKAPPPGEWPVYRREMLWKYGISGDYPLIGMRVSESDTAAAETMLRSFAELAHAGLRTELLLLPEGDGQYFRPVEKKLLALCERLELQGFLGVRGGIFLLRQEQTEETFLSLLPRICAFYSCPAKVQSGRSPLPLPNFTPPCLTPSPVERQTPEDYFAVAGGYATEEGFTLYKDVPQPAPRSFVLSGRNCGSVVTSSSLGYTFCGNAHERRLTPFAGDPGSLPDGERLYLRRNDRLYDLIACAGKAFWGKGIAVWEGKIEGESYSVLCFCCAEKPFKVVRVRFSSLSGELLYCVRPAMGSGAVPAGVLWKKEQNGALLFRSGHDTAFGTGVGLLYAKGATPLYSQTELFADRSEPELSDLVGLRANYNYVNFILGGCEENELEDLLRSLPEVSPETEQTAAEAFASSMLPPIEFHTRSKAQNLLLGHFLPYQVGACRFYARASFRQSGGAYGFRDQLQDCLALVYARPQEVREHILRCCAHQYEEGDVQHWWHPDRSGASRGIRTTCSDDLLWLPYVVADYVNKTGDSGILTEQAEYLSSPPLTGENERYELPARSFLSETVLLHCLRAFSRADRRGAHGLLLMGNCDWNDAFSAVGAEGKGESVFSTFLYVVAARAFQPLLEAHDPAAAEALQRTADTLLANAEQAAFDKDRYLRAFCDNGEVLGKDGNAECAIDILSQAFALFAGADERRCRIALDTAERTLYDPGHRILKLFDPPFDGGDLPAGYIRGYPPGIRENGGQYTHGAVWGALAFLRVGKTETALDILSGANPLLRTATRVEAEVYRSEPYALCADIYAGQHIGRGGWSWYTGSAAWYYKVFVEEVLGIRLTAAGRILDLHPRVPYEVTLRYHGTVRIVVSSGETTSLDGMPVQFPVPLLDGDHTVTFHLE
ncbi:MAG: hypothetical protein J1E00_05955 [Oscillospiraceae bacterium]|nr:hypothetical protein [Oscillospiraceae bacterium]